ncbi:hypothetical protein PS15m_010021 [Mucor circinelloides]
MMENFQQLEILETGFQTAHSLYSLYTIGSKSLNLVPYYGFAATFTEMELACVGDS